MCDTREIAELERLLTIGDDVMKNHACGKGLKMIEECQEREQMDYIANLLVFYLLDLTRFSDAMRCINIMLDSKNTVVQWNGHCAKIEYFKKNDSLLNLKNTIEDAKAFAKKEDNEQMLIHLYKEDGKTLIYENRMEEAIKVFAEMEFLSDKYHRNDMLAISKYYSAICLYRLGLFFMANDKLRETTEIAQCVKNQKIAFQSEIVRAFFLMENGKNEDVKTILKDCVDNFSMLL